MTIRIPTHSGNQTPSALFYTFCLKSVTDCNRSGWVPPRPGEVGVHPHQVRLTSPRPGKDGYPPARSCCCTTPPPNPSKIKLGYPLARPGWGILQLCQVGPPPRQQNSNSEHLLCGMPLWGVHAEGLAAYLKSLTLVSIYFVQSVS